MPMCRKHARHGNRQTGRIDPDRPSERQMNEEYCESGEGACHLRGGGGGVGPGRTVVFRQGDRER